MKFSKTFGLLTLLLVSTTQAYDSLGNSNQALSPAKINTDSPKTYLKAKNIQIGAQGIYVCIDQNWIQTEALFSDPNGLYIVDEKGGWTCGACGYYNTVSRRYCDYCNKER